MKQYKFATIKFNKGRGALLCSSCNTIIAYGFDHEDCKHYCAKCSKVQELAQ